MSKQLRHIQLIPYKNLSIEYREKQTEFLFYTA